MVFFGNISYIRRGGGLKCEILVAIVFGLENPSFWPKVTFEFLNVPRGEGGGSTGLGNIPKKYNFLMPSLRPRFDSWAQVFIWFK